MAKEIIVEFKATDIPDYTECEWLGCKEKKSLSPGIAGEMGWYCLKHEGEDLKNKKW